MQGLDALYFAASQAVKCNEAEKKDRRAEKICNISDYFEESTFSANNHMLLFGEMIKKKFVKWHQVVLYFLNKAFVQQLWKVADRNNRLAARKGYGICGGYDESRWANGERPGKFKMHYYGVGMDAGAAPEDVAEEIDVLCRELDEAEDRTGKEENIWNIAAYFHLAFENIHPFADGMKRVLERKA